MKSTRNLFSLIGTFSDVATVLSQLTFKGLCVVPKYLTYDTIQKIFEDNKSIVCDINHAGLAQLNSSPIYIEVLNGGTPVIEHYIDIGKNNIAQQFENIAIKCNCDIGDHKSNSSGLNGTPSKNDCAYCKYIYNDTPKYKKEILYRSTNFIVLPIVGQFIKGYLLIIPTAHVMSIAQIAATSLLEEFHQVLEDIRYILSLTYRTSNFLVWENGTGNSGKGKAKDSVVHAHVHIAPSNITANYVETLSKFTLTPISLKQLCNYNLHSYLLIQQDNNTWKINNSSSIYIPRQYIRQVLAEENNIEGDQWNWRLFPFTNLMRETEKDIFYAITSNWGNLPERIKTNTNSFINTFADKT